MSVLTIQRPGIPVPLTVERGGTGVTSLNGLKTSLGLGSMAYQNNTAVNIVGGIAVGLTNVGIGINTPTAPLAFADIEGNKIHLYAAGTQRYGIGISPARTRIFGSASGGVSIGTINEVDSTTFTSTLDLNSFGVSIGGGLAALTHRLIVAAGKTVWQNGSLVGINVEPTAALHVVGSSANSNMIANGFHTPNYDPGTPNRVGFYSLVNGDAANCWGVLHNGTAPSQFSGALTVHGSVVFNSTLSVVASVLAGSFGYNVSAPRWSLDINGLGFVSRLGVYYGPDVAVAEGIDFRTGLAHFDAIGIGYVVNASYSIRAGNSYFDSAGFGYAGGVGYALRATTAAIDNLYAVTYFGVGGSPDARWNFVSWGTSYFGNTVQVAHYLGCYPYAPTTPYGIRCGIAFIDQLGVGTGPYEGWDLAANKILTWAALQSSGTLYVVGTSTLSGLVGIGYAPTSGYWIRAGNSWIDSVYVGGYFSVGGPIDTRWNERHYGSSYHDGTVQFQNIIGIGGAPGTYWLRNYGNSYFDGVVEFVSWCQYYAHIVVNGKGYQPGGGAWLDTSSRYLKRHIKPIVGALDLLLAQQGREYEWDEPLHARELPGRRYGFVADEVTIAQWQFTMPDGSPAISAQGFEALCIEALRVIVHRLETVEERG